jgi:hypothetical protein
MLMTEAEARIGPTQARLLGHYERRKPKAFRQFDGWLNGDEVMGRDADGHAINAGMTWELMHGADVRILIPLNTPSADAVILLRKIIDWIERRGGADKIVNFPPEDLLENLVL